MSAVSATRARGSTMADGWMGMAALLFRFVGEFAHDFGFGDDVAVDGRLAGHLGDRGFALEQRHLEAQLVAGHNRTAELCVLDGYQEHQLFVAILDAFEDEDAGCLRHRFNDEDAGHDGKIRKMSAKKRLVGGHVLDADDTLGGKLDDFVDEQHWVAMRQDLPDLIYVQFAHGIWLL